jgi:hypothetical protein
MRKICGKVEQMFRIGIELLMSSEAKSTRHSDTSPSEHSTALPIE